MFAEEINQSDRMSHLARCSLPRLLLNLQSMRQQRRLLRTRLFLPLLADSQTRLASNQHQCYPAIMTYCQLLPHRGATVASNTLLQMRSIFTDTYFGLEKLTQSNNKQKLMVLSPDAFKERLRLDFAAHGVRNLFISDLNLFLALSDNAADMEMSRQLVETLLQGDDVIFC
jgi:hypothetical protein